MRALRRLTPALLLLLAAGCNSLSDAVSADPKDIVQVSVSPATLPADGASRATVTVQLPAATTSTNRQVQVTVTAGTFLSEGEPDNNIHLTADAEGRAVTVLVADKTVGQAIVEASAENFSAHATVEYVRAYPERIDVDPGVSSISGADGATTVVNAHLRRTVGIPTQGMVVTFTAVADNGSPIGNFVNVTPSDAAGTASAAFNPGPTRYRGGATIIARFTNPETGQVIEGRGRIEITN
jgi:hypothetical protein